MDTKRFSELVKTIYDAVEALEEMFNNERHFTPDGHMVGSIGEVLAAHDYGITLDKASTETHDGEINGRKVQIKATSKAKISISSCPEHLLVLQISKVGVGEEIYNGPGELAWKLVERRKKQKTGQHQISLHQLRELMKNVPDNQKIPRINK